MSLRKYTDDDIRKVVRLYETGIGANTIAERTGISVGYVEKLLKGKFRINVTGGRILAGHREEYRADAARRGWMKRKARLALARSTSGTFGPVADGLV